MTTMLEAAFDAGAEPTLNAMTWPDLWAGAVHQASLALLVLAAATLVVLLALAFIRPNASVPPASSPAASSILSGEPLALVLADPWYEPRPSLRGESLAATLEPGPSLPPAALPRSLYQTGLGPTDALALLALRERVAAGQLSEAPLEPSRLQFTRWLVSQGKLAG
jgi:hypothetical protein